MLHKEEISVREISQITGTDRKTVKNILKEIQTNYVAAMCTDRWKDILTLYSKVYKVVKRIMYGRCGRQLLGIKLMYHIVD